MVAQGHRLHARAACAGRATPSAALPCVAGEPNLLISHGQRHWRARSFQGSPPPAPPTAACRSAAARHPQVHRPRSAPPAGRGLHACVCKLQQVSSLRVPLAVDRRKEAGTGERSHRWFQSPLPESCHRRLWSPNRSPACRPCLPPPRCPYTTGAVHLAVIRSTGTHRHPPIQTLTADM